MNAEVEFSWTRGDQVPLALLVECSALFSTHYGVWSDHASFRPGERIRMGPERIGALLEIPGSGIAAARVRGELIAYATATRGEIRGQGRITWVTQLVVHEDYRNQDVAKRLLHSLWSFSDGFGWGLVTANPYAVRALEKATRRRCDPEVIRTNLDALHQFGRWIPYIAGKPVQVGDGESRIDTQFFVDHSQLDRMMENASQTDRWQMGEIGEGEEWLAFTFGAQPQTALTGEDLRQLLAAPEQTAREALGRMNLDAGHFWMKHAEAEARFAAEHLGLTPGSRFLDFGCGVGRHSVVLGGLTGASGVAIDFVPELVERARASAAEAGVASVRFAVGDCRTARLGEEFDAVLCLYDVIGTFPDDAENDAIIARVAEHVRRGGRVLVSVMNLELTESQAKYSGDVFADPGLLTRLRPSRTMQETGNIFDPDYYLVDPVSSIVYRKEQFEDDALLPTEVVVRDRRYRCDELIEKFEEVGIRKIWSRYVQAGRWDVPLDATDPRAKEILFLGERD
jgi:2-polyprenyl-3-methyl-5-hydroxy-6-metoxy-1,4-benzoquinol methylase/GNAT superfamily N-acetyltransferase